jgi:hypothetical protein
MGIAVDAHLFVVYTAPGSLVKFQVRKKGLTGILAMEKMKLII